MKKISFYLVLAICLLFTVNSAFAKTNIVAKPNIKVIIDSKACQLKDVPVSVNDKILVSYKSILTRLGVKNDKAHILWNPSKKSLTIVKDSTKVVFKLNSKQAVLNKKAVKLETAPVLYKNKVYIPASFIIQSLGKKYIWDDKTATIAICDASTFNKVRDVMNKSDLAMGVIKYKTAATVDFDLGGIVTVKASVTEETDSQKKIIHKIEKDDTIGIIKDTESYSINGVLYSKTGTDGSWTKTTATENSGDSLLTQPDGTSDIFCAGLTEVAGSSPDELVFEGEMAFSSVYEDTKDDKTFKAYTKLVFDKNNCRIKAMRWDASGSTVIQGARYTYSYKSEFTFSEINYEISIPDEIVNFKDGQPAQYPAYENTQYDFIICYPPGWEVIENYMGAIAFFRSPKENEADSFQENVNMTFEDLSSKPMTLDEYTDAGMKQLSQYITEYNLISSEKITLSGAPAQKIVYTGKMGTYQLKYVQVWTIIDNKAYVLSFVAETNKYEEYLKYFNEMIDSFKVGYEKVSI